MLPTMHGKMNVMFRHKMNVSTGGFVHSITDGCYVGYVYTDGYYSVYFDWWFVKGYVYTGNFGRVYFNRWITQSTV